jgi:hypothetical protein
MIFYWIDLFEHNSYVKNSLEISRRGMIYYYRVIDFNSFVINN